MTVSRVCLPRALSPGWRGLIEGCTGCGGPHKGMPAISATPRRKTRLGKGGQLMSIQHPIAVGGAPHADTLTAAAVDPAGALVWEVTVANSPEGISPLRARS